MGRSSRTEITCRLTEESREPEGISRDKETNRRFLGTNDDLRRLECSFCCPSADHMNLVIPEALEECDR
jgi:hypothetical protein